MFETREVALQVARSVRDPIAEIRKKKAGLADQLERAVMSMVLNIAEASRRIGQDRKNRWRYASGSAAEARDALELADAWGFVSRGAIEETLVLLDRVLAMLWRLEFPRKRTAVRNEEDRAQSSAPGPSSRDPRRG